MSLYNIGAKLLRKLPPETAHNLTINALSNNIGPKLKNEIDYNINLAGLKLKNPIGIAAGFDKNARAYEGLLNAGFGFVECGTVTPFPQIGNPKPRLFRLVEDEAIINAMGFNNDGLSDFVDNLRHRGNIKGIIGANIGANKDTEDKAEDYVLGLRRVWFYADYITINISSPNTKGLRDLQSKDALEDLLGRINEMREIQTKAHGKRPVFLKIAPDISDSDIENISKIVIDFKMDALIVSNTTIARPETLKSNHKSQIGGLSGRPLFNKSTEILKSFNHALNGKIDLIGVGGIASGDDAISKLEAGAKAIQLYSAFVYQGPKLLENINDAIKEYYKK